jgi:hypothetical protein
MRRTVGLEIGRAGRQLAALVATLGMLGACASGGAGADPGVEQPSGAGGAGQAGGTTTTNVAWPVKTREHVDLWLHSFAMISSDTAKIPFFRRNYRSEMQVLKNQQNIVTALDANREQLAGRLRTNPEIANAAQFLPLYFGSWEDLKTAASHFVQTEGDPRRARDPAIQAAIAALAGYFPRPADREWFRVFMNSIDDESTKFYHGYWLQQQRNRTSTVDALNTLWQQTYYPKFRRYLMGTQQSNGDMLLSLPIGGEGRTIGSSPTSVGPRSSLVTVTYPQADPNEAIYVFAHEIVGTVMNTVITDNTTPAEKRDGLDQKYASDGLVIGGALLLQRIAPELLDGYARYYLRVANVSAGNDPQAALRSAFPLPENFRAAFNRQLDIVLGGI